MIAPSLDCSRATGHRAATAMARYLAVEGC
jgi:hypothetical protein